MTNNDNTNHEEAPSIPGDLYDAIYAIERMLSDITCAYVVRQPAGAPEYITTLALRTTDEQLFRFQVATLLRCRQAYKRATTKAGVYPGGSRASNN